MASLLIEQQLGYQIPNLVGVAAWTKDGMPAVAETYPLRRNHQNVEVEPFPTLFWLTDRRIAGAVAAIEARGGITEAKEAMADHFEDLFVVHERYKKRRWNLLSAEDEILVKERNWTFRGGVAGLNDHKGVKCLHAHYACFLVDAYENVNPVNPIGEWVHDRLPEDIKQLVVIAS